MKLSVITINYNNRDGLRKTIESVVNQTYKDFEYIVIDGGSNDGSVDVIKEYADRIDYWVSEPDKGIYNAMNKGIDVANGEYCIFMNSGDGFYNQDVVAEIFKIELVEDVLCGDMYLSIGCIKEAPKVLTFKYFYEEGLGHQACLIKTVLLKQYLYNENLKIVSDWEFFLKVLILKNATYRRIDIIIADFDFNGISQTNFELHKQERWSVLKSMFPQRVLDDYMMNSTYDFRRLFYWIEKTNFHRPIYIMNVLIIKLVSFFTGAKWIKEFGIKERK